MNRYDYRRKFTGKTLEELELMLPYYKEQFNKYLGGHPDNVKEAYRDLTFLERKIHKIKFVESLKKSN